MRHIIAIIDSDERYGKKLCAYLNAKGRIDFGISYFPDIQCYQESAPTFQTEILLIEEKLYSSVGSMPLPETTIVRLEDDFLGREIDVKGMKKYVNVENFLHHILTNYQPTKDKSLEKIEKEEVQIFGVFSPYGRCGKTSFAIALCAECEKMAPALLVSFDEYSGLLREAGQEYPKDLSDILYCYRQEQYAWEKLGMAVYTKNTLHYIPPARYPEDIVELGIEEIEKLLLRMAYESQYHTVIVDFGSLGKRACDLFRICEKVYMPIPRENDGRMEEFFSYLDETGREKLKKKLEEITLPSEQGEKSISSLLISPVAALAREVLKGVNMG